MGLRATRLGGTCNGLLCLFYVVVLQRDLVA